MLMAVTAEETPRLLRSRVEAIPTPTTKAVVWWAWAGAAFVVLQMYIQLGWIFSKDFRHIGTGATPVPTYMKVSSWGNGIFWFAFMLAVVYWFVVRPWRRDRRLGLDSLIVLAFYWTWWQDPLFDYVTHAWNYSSVNLNMGGWAGHIPGWISPNGGNIPEPLLWVLPFYVGLGSCAAIGFSAMMRRWRARNPTVRTSTMLLTVYACCFVFDLALEFFWVRTGLYTYAGTAHGWNLFAGRWYQFPIYEPIAVGFLGMGWACCRYFVNDRGETLAERGLDRVKASGKQKTLIRFLALVGVLNVSFFFSYSLLVQVWNIHGGAWPKAAQERSYLTNGLCGAGTGYSCAGSSAAIPVVGNSVHVGPGGRLVIPPGTDTSKLQFVPLSAKKQ
jgi:hypothetical protein